MKQLGNIAALHIAEFTEENLPSGVLQNNDKVQLCSSIDLSYPVLESLNYSSRMVDKNSVVLVLSEKGRPSSFQKGNTWSGYDILNVLIDGTVYQCFRSSLRIVTG